MNEREETRQLQTQEMVWQEPHKAQQREMPSSVSWEEQSLARREAGAGWLQGRTWGSLVENWLAMEEQRVVAATAWAMLA